MNNRKAFIIGTYFALTGISNANYCTSTTDADGKNYLTCTKVIYYYSSSQHGGLSLIDYESVTINTIDNAEITPLSGWGVYGNSSQYDFNNLIISTKGSAADGIIAKNGKSLITMNNYTVVTEGASADGINIGKESSGSIVTINGNADVKIKDGMGIRSNATYKGAGVNTIIIKGDTTVRTEGVGGSQTGYAVYAGNDSVYGSNDKAQIDLRGKTSIETTGKNAYGIYAKGNGYIRVNNVEVLTTNSGATGIYAIDNTPVLGNRTPNGGVIDLLGDVKITVNEGVNAIYASGKDAYVRSFDTDLNQQRSGIYTINGNINADKKGTVDLSMTNGSHFTGIANSNDYGANGVQNTTTNGTVNLNISGANSRWTMTGNSVVSNLMLNESTLAYSAPANGATFIPKMLIVSGNYTSTNGNLLLNSILSDDFSPIDKLVVKGDTAGYTNVMINNLGGNGALTIQGIEIVEVDGNSAGVFGNDARIVAGSYDYFVRSGAGLNGANAKNWYLISDYSPISPPIEPPPIEPPPVEPPPIDPPPAPPITPIPPQITFPQTQKPVYRPESGSYIANLAAANTMFVTRLQDRLGETQYLDAFTGELMVSSLWMRNVGGHNRFKDSGGQLETQGNRYVIQIGDDLVQWSSNGKNRWHIGAMVGYANNESKTRSNVTGYRSKGKIDGYSTGLYATWFENNIDKTGMYIDSWFLYNWFDNEVNGDQLRTEKYKSKGISASIEGGYTFNLGESPFSNMDYYLQPKAQVVYMGVEAKNHVEYNGTKVSGSGDDNIQTRLGLRAYIGERSNLDSIKNKKFQVFIEANWIHNSKDFGVTMNRIYNEQRGAKDIGELKIGVEGKLSKNINVWSNVGQQMGSKGYRDTVGMIGIKYNF